MAKVNLPVKRRTGSAKRLCGMTILKMRLNITRLHTRIIRKTALRDYALYSIAWTYQKRTEYSKAAGWYGKLIAEFPQSSLTPGAHVRIGECFYYAKKLSTGCR